MKRLIALATSAFILAPLPALAGICTAPVPGPNDSHLRIINQAADAGAWVTVYSYEIAGRHIAGAWCVPAGKDDTHGLRTTIIAVRVEVEPPACSHGVKLDRELPAGDPEHSGVIHCTAKVTGSNGKYVFQ